MFRTAGERTSVKPKIATTRRRYQSVIIGDLRRPTAAPVSKNRPVEAAVRTASRVTQLHVDIPLVLIVITLLVFGLIMVYSASYDYSWAWYGDPMTIFQRQLMWLGVGTFALVLLMSLDYHLWRAWAVPAIGATIAMLLIVLFANNVLNGAARTLWGGSIQPSELAKMTTVIYLSVWLYSKRELLHSFAFGLASIGFILGVVGGLILLQPDLSAAITIVILGGLMFYLAGGDFRQMLFAMIIAIVVGYIVIQISDTGRQRLEDYFIGIQNPLEGSYHVRRAFGAFVSGGWLGVGLGKAETKLTGLPVAPTDSIFAVVGEETGVIGVTLLLCLYLALLWRGLAIARRAPDEIGSLMAAGLCIWIVLEAFINMAVMVNLLPFAGNPLPFISAGGSNLVMSLAAIGIVLNISRSAVRNDSENGRSSHAAVDLRRRNRRRSVSGAGGSAGAGDVRARRTVP